MKNHLINLLFGLYIVFCIASCSSHKEKNGISNPVDIPYTVDLTQFIEKPGGIKAISSIADSITYVALKTETGEPMDQIRQAALTSEHIYIVDRALSIYIFNRSGKFIRKINHKGRGPGEYYAPDFTFNDNNKC